MTRAALAKLLVLVILAFIICLPEFFTSYQASKVNFHCLPYRPCERGKQVKAGGNEKIKGAEITREDVCDPSRTFQKWEQACAQENQSNTTDPVSRRGDEELKKSWFMCETDIDMAELHSNISSSAGKVRLEVSVELQTRDEETLNLTLYGSSNHSSLHLRPPEEEDADNKTDDEGQRKAFYCCLPVPPTLESANQNRCLLWLANQTVLAATTKEKVPWKRTVKDEWQCVLRVLWLALLGLVLLILFITVLGQIYWERTLCQKPRAHRVGYNVTDQVLNDAESHTETLIPRGITPHSNRSWFWSELSPIQEVDSQEDVETVLDGKADHCYTANLHHRGHPSTSSVPRGAGLVQDEQPEDYRDDCFSLCSENKII